MVKSLPQLLFVVLAALVSVGAAGIGAQSGTSSRRPTVLFMCPHGAAKSVMASAYFQKLAKERGLNVRVDAAGTDPEPQLSKGVVARLQRDGVAIPIDKPRAATNADMKAADIVISMGCDLSKLATPTGELRNWSVPDFSANFDVAEQSIRDQVTRLVDELVGAQKKKGR
jgi:arsenate reductase (thioredoxin)